MDTKSSRLTGVSSVVVSKFELGDLFVDDRIPFMFEGCASKELLVLSMKSTLFLLAFELSAASSPSDSEESSSTPAVVMSDLAKDRAYQGSICIGKQCDTESTSLQF